MPGRRSVMEPGWHVPDACGFRGQVCDGFLSGTRAPPERIDTCPSSHRTSTVDTCTAWTTPRRGSRPTVLVRVFTRWPLCTLMPYDLRVLLARSYAPHVPSGRVLLPSLGVPCTGWRAIVAVEEVRMKLWSNSFSDGEPIPSEFAFGLPDAASHMVFGPNPKSSSWLVGRFRTARGASPSSFTTATFRRARMM